MYVFYRFTIYFGFGWIIGCWPSQTYIFLYIYTPNTVWFSFRILNFTFIDFIIGFDTSVNTISIFKWLINTLTRSDATKYSNDNFFLFSVWNNVLRFVLTLNSKIVKIYNTLCKFEYHQHSIVSTTKFQNLGANIAIYGNNIWISYFFLSFSFGFMNYKITAME